MKDTLSNFVRKELGAFLDSQAAVLTAGAQEVVTRKQLIEYTFKYIAERNTDAGQ